jgi:hypothetical protein
MARNFIATILLSDERLAGRDGGRNSLVRSWRDLDDLGDRCELERLGRLHSPAKWATCRTTARSWK